MIETLTIENWKAFEQRTFRFDKGVNFLVGKNGTGKTTVLEAISLALSGDTSHPNFQSLVRVQEKPATLDLHFTKVIQS
jgi:DNA repair exonuclease SbcCD ATPase subunit